MLMRVLIDLTNVVGFATATAFLALFRPSRILRSDAFNALSPWFTLWLIFLSVLLVSVVGGSFVSGHITADPEQIVYLVLRAVGDAVLIARLVTFLRFRHLYASARTSRVDTAQSG